MKISVGSTLVTFTYSRWGAVSLLKVPSGVIPLLSLVPASKTSAEQQILQSISVRSSDLPAGRVVTLIGGGDQLQGQVTLDLCSNTYASERLRVARRLVSDGRDLSTEAVI